MPAIPSREVRSIHIITSQMVQRLPTSYLDLSRHSNPPLSRLAEIPRIFHIGFRRTRVPARIASANLSIALTSTFTSRPILPVLAGPFSGPQTIAAPAFASMELIIVSLPAYQATSGTRRDILSRSLLLFRV